MLDLLFSNPVNFLIFAFSLIIAIDVHEFAHAWAADKLGDPTPRLAGRLTLNPLAHLDPLGTLALFIVQFGWGKPVPIDTYNLRDPKKDSALISLAGPLSNLILALILALVLRFIPVALPLQLVLAIIVLNVNLAIFNLLPIPPLDGAKILIGFLPHNLAWQVEQNLNQYGILLLVLILFPFFGGTPLVITLISPVINFILKILSFFWLGKI